MYYLNKDHNRVSYLHQYNKDTIKSNVIKDSK